MLRFLLALVATVYAVAAEPSVFKAGNIDSKDPYGLSDQEKAIHKNLQSIKSIEKDLFTINQNIDRLTKTVDGLNETVRSNSEAIRALTLKIEAINSQLAKQDERDKKQDGEIEQLFKKDAEFEKQANDAFAKQNQNHKKLSDSIVAIQKHLENSVGKQDYESVIAQLTAEIEANRKAILELGGKIEKKEAKEKKSSKDKAGTKTETKVENSDEILKRTKQLIESQKYSDARKNALILIERKEHLAEAHFYLGSTYYFQNQNQKAIAEFKESTRIDENAKHMPILLFYTAIAFERDKNSVEAKKFYEAVVRLYPDHYIADSAKSRLEKFN